MSDDSGGEPVYVRYGDFLSADPRRHGDALELGHDWRDGAERYRICFYVRTGELTAERLDPERDLELEDFEAGVAGPVEVLARFPDREALEQVLGRWPNVAPNQPRTLAWLRRLLSTEGSRTAGA